MPNVHDSEAAPRFQRQFIEDTIESLITYLDALDGDADCEPWLASPECHPQIRGYTAGDGSQQRWAYGSSDDGEEQDEELGFIAEAHGTSTWIPELSLVIGRRRA